MLINSTFSYLFEKVVITYVSERFNEKRNVKAQAERNTMIQKQLKNNPAKTNVEVNDV
jgi:5-methylcytosine-specific restriction endonuclease McrBC regulatory subunit McrC